MSRLAPTLREGATARLPRAAQPAGRVIRRGWAACSSAGRAAIITGVACWLLGLRLGWQELFLAAACCAIALAVAVGFVIGRPSLDIEIELDPSRVKAGEKAMGRLVATNRSRARLRKLNVEVPVGESVAGFEVPALAAGASHDEVFIVPTIRRSVIAIGPARAVRSDPLGLLRRDAVEQTAAELFVHPLITPLESLAAGLQRDLEGQVTRDLSSSDLAFHALRDYQPGDDRRHVHWRSTAKIGRLVVRQYQDTRRLRLTLVVDGATGSYQTEEEFELAMSVAGSICARAARDSQDVYLVAASHAVSAASQRRLLDTISRGTLAAQGQDLASLTSRAARQATDTSVLMLVTGSVIPFSAVKHATVYFGPDVKVMAIRVEPDAPPGISRSGDLTVLAVQTLDGLPALLSVAVTA
jgi:uncharacterized protein (DUF58 family)